MTRTWRHVLSPADLVLSSVDWVMKTFPRVMYGAEAAAGTSRLHVLGSEH